MAAAAVAAAEELVEWAVAVAVAEQTADKDWLVPASLVADKAAHS